MIDSLKGEILDKGPGHVVVDCHGVGYLVHISLNEFSQIPDRGPVRLYIHYAVSVDVRSGSSEHRLFGFASAEGRHLFRQLITVQGVSTTVAMSILGARSTSEVRNAIAASDENMLRGIKGIGPKLAQRIISELGARMGEGPTALLAGAVGAGNSLRAEALSALVSLGLDRTKAERALHKTLESHGSQPPELEELIRLTLKNQ